MRTYRQTGRSLAIALLIISGAILIFTPVAHAIFVIDDFDQPVPATPVLIGSSPAFTSPNPTHVETGDPGIMGGERDALFEVTGTPLGSFALIANVGAGQLDALASQAMEITLQYDGVDADTVGPPAALIASTMSPTVDLVTDPLGGTDHEAFAFVFDSGGGPFALTMIVQSPDGPDAGTAPEISTFTGTLSVTAPGTGLILFNDEIGWDHPYGLDIPDPAAADFKNVERVEFRLESSILQGFVLDSIGTRVAIPEPGSMLLAVFGGLCLVGCRRRRRHKA